MIELSPMVTPSRINTLVPTHTWLPILISFSIVGLLFIGPVLSSVSCVHAMMFTLCPMAHHSPITTFDLGPVTIRPPLK